jgi:K+-sensing histidine kinase KdpD
MIHKSRTSAFLELLRGCLLASGAVLLLTIPLEIVGSRILGDAVIALLYLLPIAWSAERRGLVPGLSAGLTAALCFDFLFVPPFYTFAVGRLEGWLVLAIFLGVAVFVVEQIHAGRLKTREAVFLYELSTALAEKRTQEAAARAVARQLHQLYQTDRVTVSYRPAGGADAVSVAESRRPAVEEPPDRILPIENAWGLVGEIQLWRGPFGALPPEDSRLFRGFVQLAAEALERTRLMEERERELSTAVQLNPLSRMKN